MRVPADPMVWVNYLSFSKFHLLRFHRMNDYSLGNMNAIRSLDLVSSKLAADILECTVQHLRLLIRSGRIEATKQGRDWFVSRESIADFKTDREQSRSILAPIAEQLRLFDSAEYDAIVNVASVPQRSPFRYP